VDDPGACAVDGADLRVVAGQRYDVKILGTDPVRGPRDAHVTLVVFSDFQCPYCEQFETTVDDLLDRYPDVLRIVWKDNPLDMHPHARPAALLARTAYEKGGSPLFWEVHEDIFDAQADLESALEQIADAHELEWPPPERVAPLVEASVEHARSLGVVSTPTSFVNGRAVVGSQPLEAYTALVDEELADRALR
jgi:protein-disulfide isomerase